MTGNDANIMPYIDIGNIACGSHASNPEHMAETVKLAISHGVKISAHPGYADKENFGRISQSLNYEQTLLLVDMQVQLLQNICEQLGTTLYSIKPHGALYHDMIQQHHVRNTLIRTAQKYNIPLIVPAIKSMWSIPVIREAFADRGYISDGSLVPRSQEGALYLDQDKIVDQALQFTEINKLKADTLCFHGDNPASVLALKTLYAGN